jgi:hypothetical protein
MTCFLKANETKHPSGDFLGSVYGSGLRSERTSVTQLQKERTNVKSSNNTLFDSVIANN